MTPGQLGFVIILAWAFITTLLWAVDDMCAEGDNKPWTWWHWSWVWPCWLGVVCVVVAAAVSAFTIIFRLLG